MEESVLTQIKKEVFRNEMYTAMTMAQTLEAIKDLQYEKRVAQDRVTELEIRVGQMRQALAELNRLTRL